MPYRGVPQAILDTRYLKLDASNDPITAGLEIRSSENSPLVNLYNPSTSAFDVAIQFRSGYTFLANASDILGQLVFAPYSLGGKLEVILADAAAGVLTEVFRMQEFGGGGWITIPTTGPSGIGVGAPGTNPIFAYVSSAHLWQFNTVEGDFVFRNIDGRLLYGTSAGQSPDFAIDRSGLIGINELSMGAMLHITNHGAATKGLIVKGAASQSANLQEWQDSAANILSRINKDGYIVTGKVAVPADGDLSASELAYWFDDTNGAAFAMFKGKTQNGTVVSGSVALA